MHAYQRDSFEIKCCGWGRVWVIIIISTSTIETHPRGMIINSHPHTNQSQIFHSKVQIIKHHISTFSFINKTNLKSTIIQNYFFDPWIIKLINKTSKTFHKPRLYIIRLKQFSSSNEVKINNFIFKDLH